MKAVKITTDNKVIVINLDGNLSDGASEALGCAEIAFVRLRRTMDGTALAVDECGMLKGLPINRAASLMFGAQRHGSPIVGDVLVVGCDTCDTLDYEPLSNDEAESIECRLCHQFSFLKKEA